MTDIWIKWPFSMYYEHASVNGWASTLFRYLGWKCNGKIDVSCILIILMVPFNKYFGVTMVGNQKKISSQWLMIIPTYLNFHIIFLMKIQTHARINSNLTGFEFINLSHAETLTSSRQRSQPITIKRWIWDAPLSECWLKRLGGIFSLCL